MWTGWDTFITIAAIWLLLYFLSRPYPKPMGKRNRHREEKAALLMGKRVNCPDINACCQMGECLYKNCHWFETGLPIDSRPLLPVKPRIKGFVPITGEPADLEVKDCQVITLPIKEKKERETFVWNDEEGAA